MLNTPRSNLSAKDLLSPENLKRNGYVRVTGLFGTKIEQIDKDTKRRSELTILRELDSSGYRRFDKRPDCAAIVDGSGDAWIKDSVPTEADEEIFRACRPTTHPIPALDCHFNPGHIRKRFQNPFCDPEVAQTTSVAVG